MDRKRELKFNDTSERWVDEYRRKLRRKYLTILEGERKARFADGLFLFLGEWRTIEEIVEANLQERKRKNAILIDLMVLLLFSIVSCPAALYALFRWLE